MDCSTYVETVRGCRSHCTFCFYPRSSSVLRVLDVERSAALVASVRDQGAREVVFLDPTFNHRPGFEPLLEALARVNPDRALSFFAEVRAEGLTAEHAAMLARAGFTRLEIGLQSVNRETLKRVKRGGSPEKVAAAPDVASGCWWTRSSGSRATAPTTCSRVDFLDEHGLADGPGVRALAPADRDAHRRDGVEFDPLRPTGIRATMDAEALRATLERAGLGSIAGSTRRPAPPRRATPGDLPRRPRLARRRRGGATRRAWFDDLELWTAGRSGARDRRPTRSTPSRRSTWCWWRDASFPSIRSTVRFGSPPEPLVPLADPGAAGGSPAADHRGAAGGLARRRRLGRRGAAGRSFAISRCQAAADAAELEVSLPAALCGRSRRGARLGRSRRRISRSGVRDRGLSFAAASSVDAAASEARPRVASTADGERHRDYRPRGERQDFPPRLLSGGGQDFRPSTALGERLGLLRVNGTATAPLDASG